MPAFVLSRFVAVVAAVALTAAVAHALTAAELEARIRAETHGAGLPEFTIAPPAAFEPALTLALSPDDGYANCRAIAAALARCKAEGLRRLVIPRGRYVLGDRTHPFAALIDLTGLTDFTFDGQDSEFICQAKAVFVSLRDCHRVAMTNYRLDWDWMIEPIQSLARVAAVDPAGGYIDLFYPDEAAPATDRPVELVEVDGTTYNVAHRGLGVVGAAAYRAPTRVAPHVLRFTASAPGGFKGQPVAVGQYYVARHYDYQFPGTRVTACSAVSFRGVITYSTLGMGYLVRDSDHLEFIDSKITRRPGTPWPWRFSSASDGIHCANNHGYLKFERVEIDHAGDDAINIHDELAQGIRLVPRHPDQLVLTNAPAWRHPFTRGDRVELRRDDFSPTGFAATLAAQPQYDARRNECTLTLDAPVPAGLSETTIVLNRGYDSGHYVVRGCDLHDNKVRGMVVYTSHGTIEHNTFARNYSPGLFILCASTKFKEGADPSDIIVRDNVFAGNDIKRKTYLTMPNNLVIAAETPEAGIVQYPMCHHIIVERNLIRDCPYAAIEVASAKDVVVAHNTIVNPNLFGDLPALVTGSIIVQKCSAVVLHDNTVRVEPGVTSYHTNLAVDPATAKVDVFTDGPAPSR